MRLIDAHGSYTINASDNTGYSLAFGGGIISVADEFGHIEAEFDADDTRSIDAVPVVRCGECRKWNSGPDSYGRSDGPKGKCMKTFEVTSDDDFCSYGERKDGAE